ncbi:unnamed protein product, partial [Brenthis ino]
MWGGHLLVSVAVGLVVRVVGVVVVVARRVELVLAHVVLARVVALALALRLALRLAVLVLARAAAGPLLARRLLPHRQLLPATPFCPHSRFYHTARLDLCDLFILRLAFRTKLNSSFRDDTCRKCPLGSS